MRTLSLFHILQNSLGNRNIHEFENSLDKLIEVADQKNDYSLSSGLLGIGWLISFLNQYEIFDLDVEQILSEIDDQVYRLAINEIVTEPPNLERIIEIVTYYQQRLKISFRSFYRGLIAQEATLLLIDRILAIISSRKISPSAMSKILLKLSSLALDFKERSLEEAFYREMEAAINYFETKVEEKDGNDMEAIMFLLLAAYQYKNSDWEERLEKLKSEIFNFCSCRIESLAYLANLFRSKMNEISTLMDLNMDNDSFFSIITDLKFKLPT